MGRYPGRQGPAGIEGQGEQGERAPVQPDVRVYPGSPAVSTAGAAHDVAMRRSRARTVGALLVSAVMLVCSMAYFCLHPAAIDTLSGTVNSAAPEEVALSKPPDEGGDDFAESVSSAGEGGEDAPAPARERTDEPAHSDDASGDMADDRAPAGQSDMPTPAPGAGREDGAEGKPPTAPSTLSVSVAVDSSSVGSPVAASSTLSLNPGATAYDALCSLGLSVDARGTSFGTYVAGIGGLSEFDHGGGSGWKYKVNGVYPSHAASAHELADGDVIVWVYVTSG